MDEKHHEIRRVVVGRAFEPQLFKMAEESPARSLIDHFSFAPRVDFV